MAHHRAPGIPSQIQEKTINDLHFSKLGPLVLKGIDFEGEYPAKIESGSIKLSESNVLKELGYKELEH